MKHGVIKNGHGNKLLDRMVMIMMSEETIVQKKQLEK